MRSVFVFSSLTILAVSGAAQAPLSYKLPTRLPTELSTKLMNYFPAGTSGFLIKTGGPNQELVAIPLTDDDNGRLRALNCYRCGLKNKSTGVSEDDCKRAGYSWGGSIEEINKRCK